MEIVGRTERKNQNSQKELRDFHEILLLKASATENGASETRTKVPVSSICQE
jgi:hypothetical protein